MAAAEVSHSGQREVETDRTTSSLTYLTDEKQEEDGGSDVWGGKCSSAQGGGNLSCIHDGVVAVSSQPAGSKATDRQTDGQTDNATAVLP